jgi:lipoprotein-anchoring transpeptidase ErfK/SrfK
MVRPSAATALVALLVAALGLAAVASWRRAAAQRDAGAAAAAPARRPSAAPNVPTRALEPLRTVAGSSTAPAPPPRHMTIRVRPGHAVALRAHPGGPVVTRVGAATQFGSPTVLAVAKEHGRWLGVTSTNLPNGKLGWLKRGNDSFDQRWTPIAITIDLSRRRLTLRSRGRVLRRATVGIGRPSSPTPTGRFAITDKLPGSRYGAYYGCCILALSGHQTNTPTGWRGGDRLAIHGTNEPSSVGVPSSAGCLHARRRDLDALMRRVPLGTPVLIRR